MSFLKKGMVLVMALILMMGILPANGAEAAGIIKSKITMQVSVKDVTSGGATVQTNVKNPGNNTIVKVQYTLYDSSGRKLETVEQNVGKNSSSVTLSFKTSSFRSYSSLKANTTYTIEVNLVLKGLYRDVTVKKKFTTAKPLTVSVSTSSSKSGMDACATVKVSGANPSRMKITQIVIVMNGKKYFYNVSKTDANYSFTATFSGLSGSSSYEGTAYVVTSGGAVYAAGFSGKTCESYRERMNRFLSLKRYRNGQPYGNVTFHGYRQCAAFCAEFVDYVFFDNGKKNRSSGNPKTWAWHTYSNAGSVKPGDVIWMVTYNRTNGTKSTHWFVVIAVQGDSLYVAEGNWGGVVRVGWNYKVTRNGRKIQIYSGNKLYGECTDMKVYRYYK